MYKYLAFCLLLAQAKASFFEDCGSKLGTVNSVGVSNCKENVDVCVLKRNTNASISINFTAKEAATSVKTVVHGVIMNLPVPFPLPQDDACKDSGLTCPLADGGNMSYVATLPILKSYPKVRVDVKWELQDQNGEDLVCILIAAKIK